MAADSCNIIFNDTMYKNYNCLEHNTNLEIKPFSISNFSEVWLVRPKTCGFIRLLCFEKSRGLALLCLYSQHSFSSTVFWIKQLFNLLSSSLCKNHAKSEKNVIHSKKRLHIFIFVIKLFYGLYYEVCTYSFILLALRR